MSGLPLRDGYEAHRKSEESLKPTQKEIEREAFRIRDLFYDRSVLGLSLSPKAKSGWLRLARESLRRKAMLEKVYECATKTEAWDELSADELRRAMK